MLNHKYTHTFVKYDKLYMNFELFLFVFIYNFWSLCIKILVNNKKSERLL